MTKLTTFLILLSLCIASLFYSCEDSPTPLSFKSTQINFDHFPYLGDLYVTTNTVQKMYEENSRTSLMAAYLNHIGENQAAMTLYEQGETPEAFDVNMKAILEEYHPVPAIDYIKKAAKNHDITIVNEAHHIPLHRVFTHQLLADMYEIGYRHLGLETLINQAVFDSTLNANQYPILKSGTYTLDPRFGNMVRDALEMGYTVFAYERTQGRGKDREIEQAENIAQHLAKHPNEKILVHCGYGHVKEGYYGGRWEKAMAQRLKDRTGKAPLTIDQVVYQEQKNKALEHPLYGQLSLQESSILIHQNGQVLPQDTSKAYTDLHVFHPRATFEKGREKAFLFGDYQLYSLNLSALQMNCPCIVRAIKANEPVEAAVPMDVVEIKNKTEEAALILKPGAYKIVVGNEAKEMEVADFSTE